MSIKIELTPFEVLVGGLIGTARNDQALRGRFRESTGQSNGDKFGNNIEGLLGEIAVCRWRKIYWDMSMGAVGGPDAGPYEVRTNCSRLYDDLNLRPGKDELKKNKISVCAFTPVFRLDGWIWGDEAMKAAPCEWFRLGAPGRPPAWWVPRRMLHPIEELPTVEQTLQMMQQREFA
jgi:hypothetical protein